MQNKQIKIVCILALALVFSSCGYRFTPVGGIVPENAKTIAVPVFLNSTNEPYIDVELTKAVVEEFLTDGRLEIANLDNTDLVLRGKVLKFDLTPAAYAAPASNTVASYVQTYNVSFTVSLVLEDLKTQKVLLNEKGLSANFIASYPVTLSDSTTTGITVTKLAKDGAIKKACKDIASTIRSRVLEGF
jgi:hypothetical protein